jgi:hypothetical protein
LKYRITLLVLVVLMALAAAFALGASSTHRLAGWTWDTDSVDASAALAKPAPPNGWKWTTQP